MNRHQRRAHAKAKPVRLPPAGSDDYKVLRVLVAQMPMIHQVAALEQIDVQSHRRIAAMVIITR
jgi:hypothetical protein